MRRTVRLPLEQLQPYLLDPPLAERGQGAEIRRQESGDQVSFIPVPPPLPPHPSSLIPIDWPSVYRNDHPVEIEVGFGKGLFLLTAAAARPDVNFLGIEIERKYELFTANRVAKRELGNVRLICADARIFLRERVRTGSVQAVYAFFPDPWWKQRHRKRRLFTPEFVAQCARVLRPGGHLHVVTDVGDYFAEIQRLLAQQVGLRELPPLEAREPGPDCAYLTNFARKYRQEGRPIFRAVYEAGDGKKGVRLCFA